MCVCICTQGKCTEYLFLPCPTGIGLYSITDHTTIARRSSVSLFVCAGSSATSPSPSLFFSVSRCDSFVCALGNGGNNDKHRGKTCLRVARMSYVQSYTHLCNDTRMECGRDYFLSVGEAAIGARFSFDWVCTRPEFC